MGSLSSFKLDSDVVVEAERDTLGSGGFTLESDGYDMVMDVVYMSKSQGGATAINFDFKKPDGSNWKHTIYISNRQGGNTYKDKKTGEKKPLPGYSQVNTICQLSIGKELHDLETEEKVINVYSYDAKGEIPTKVDCITALHGEQITLGIMKTLEDKNVKNDQGVYVPSGDTKDGNEITKIFRAKDHLTKLEILSKADKAEFYDDWVDKNKGEIKDKSKGAKGNTGTPGMPKTPAGSTATTESLFT